MSNVTDVEVSAFSECILFLIFFCVHHLPKKLSFFQLIIMSFISMSTKFRKLLMANIELVDEDMMQITRILCLFLHLSLPTGLEISESLFLAYGGTDIGYISSLIVTNAEGFQDHDMGKPVVPIKVVRLDDEQVNSTFYF